MVRSLVLFLIAAACHAASPAAAPATTAFRWPEAKKVAVSFSFDDARPTQVDAGVPLFDKYGVKVTFFVQPRNMEKRLAAWKDAARKSYELGNHSNTHPCTVNFAWSRSNALEDYTVASMERELDGASADTERLVGVKPVTFAYPCGQKFIGRGTATQSYVPLIAKRFLVGRGFKDEAANDPVRCDLAQTLGVDSDEMPFEQMRKVVDDAAKEGRWVVFAGHDIGQSGFQTTRVSTLEQFLKYAQAPGSGIWLDTVERVARYILAQRPAK